MPQPPQPQRLQRGRPWGVPLAVLVGLGLVLPACRAADPPRGAALAEALILTPPAAPAAPAAPASTVPVLPTTPGLPRAADGRTYPLVPADPRQVAELLVQVEAALRDPATPAADLPTLGHQQQVIYRVLARQQALDRQVRPLIPTPWRSVVERHVAARREFLAMHRGGSRPTAVPAWRIIQPEPAAHLLRYYREASQETGIPWEVVAGVNLVETGMGRIDGISVADARGPMQFLPTTWAEPGIGKGGDIRDPRTAIHAAARYLVRRGGLRDIRKGLWGYNNSDHYGRAVLLYASLLRDDPRAYVGLYNWEIHFVTSAGDLWLPVGYDQRQRLPVATFLQRSPASAPPSGPGW